MVPVCHQHSQGLFIQGGVQMLICEVIVGFLIKQNFAAPGNDALLAAIIAFVCLYVAGFAWSWGPLGWLVPAEVQPLETRAAGTGCADATPHICGALVHRAHHHWCALQCTLTGIVWVCETEPRG